MKKYTICIFGASGFIGRHLVMALHSQGHKIHIFSRQTCPSYLQEKPSIRYFQGDFFNKQHISEALQGCDLCVHLLWTTIPASSNENPLHDAQTNIIGTLQLLECLKKLGVPRLIFSSSAGTVYGKSESHCATEAHATNPINAYGISKLTVEKYLELYSNLYGLKYACLRIANPYGPFQELNTQQGVVANFLNKALADEPIHIWGDGSVVRDFLYIGDMIKAFLLTVQSAESNIILNIGSGKGLSLNELLVHIENITQKKLIIHYEDSRKCDVSRSVACIKKAQTVLGWQPRINIEMGIKHTWDYLLQV